MNQRANILIVVAVVPLFCTTTEDEAAAQALTVTPASPTISVGQAQQFTSPDVSNAASVEAGDYHVCITLQNGEARCSGNNSAGQLGNGTVTDSSTPVPVFSISQAAGVSAGGFHSCAVLRSGTVECWGRNTEGQLGDGSTTSSDVPVTVSGITTAIAVAAGYHHTCALLQDGAVRCWGDNSYGELGDGTPIDPNFPRGGASGIHSSVPVAVTGINTAVSVTASDGYHSCAVLQDGTVRCWGDNVSGQLGDGSRNRSSTPVTVASITTAITVGSGDFHTCARLSDGRVSCWGLNYSGQLGDGTANDSETPVLVSGISTAVGVSVGVVHTCAVLQDGTARCWGNNSNGQVGDGTTTNRFAPVSVSGITTATSAVAAGNNDSCLVLRGGLVRCWGMNTYGELGTGATSDTSTPTAVAGINATWTSGDTSVATIDATGLATGVGPGSATIMAAFGGRTGSATLTVLGPRTLTVALDGSGIVTSNPAGIDCGASCSASYGHDTVVTLTAAPTTGFNFIAWSGCDSVSTTTCAVTMTAARSISASFKKPTLTLSKAGNGRGYVLSSEPGIDCPPNVSGCMASYDSGTSLTLAASPAEGSSLDGWTGCDASDGSFCQLTMNASKPVTATFTLLRFALSVDKPGIGAGTVTSSPGGIDCGSTCSTSYDYGTVVTLTASPALGSLFVGWNGCDAASGATCAVTIGAARSVSANFVGVPIP